MELREHDPNEERIQKIILSGRTQREIDDNILHIEYSLADDLDVHWPDDVSKTFMVVESEYEKYWKLIENNEQKIPDDLVVLYHKKGKEITPENFLESDIIKGKKGKTIAVIAGALTTALAAGGISAAYLIAHKKKN